MMQYSIPEVKIYIRHDNRVSRQKLRSIGLLQYVEDIDDDGEHLVITIGMDGSFSQSRCDSTAYRVGSILSGAVL